MTDDVSNNGTAPDRSKMLAKIAERRATKAGSPSVAQPDWSSFAGLGTEDLAGDRTGSLSPYNLAIDAACDSITVKEAYVKLSKGKFLPGHERRTGEGVKISCPIPGHRDTHPSAFLNTEKNVWNCGACNEGGDVLTIAGFAYGLDPKGPECYQIKQRLARELRGVDRAAFVESASPVVLVDEPAPVLRLVKAVEEEAPEIEVKDYPTFDLKQVLPGSNTFLDRYVAEASKADVPREFPLWVGLSILSTAIGRRVALKKVEFPTYGNLAICLTSQSASGKGRSMRAGVEVLRQALPYEEESLLSGLEPEGVLVMALPGSGESLVQSLDIQVDMGKGNPIKHLATPTLVEFEEMQQLIAKAGGKDSAYKTYILQFADCIREIGTKSLKNGHYKVLNGFVTFLTATQPKHLRSQFSQRDQTSGLLNRFIFPFGKPIAQRSWGLPDLDWNLPIVSLKMIHTWTDSLPANNPAGDEFWIDEDAWDEDAKLAYVSFHQKQIQPAEIGSQSDLLGRMGLNILRLILLFAANSLSERVQLGHVKSAIALHSYMRDCALLLAKEVAATEMSDAMQAVLDAVDHVEAKEMRPATRRHLDKASAVVCGMNAEQFNDVITRLMRTKHLVHVIVKSRTGKGRSGTAWTTDAGQWTAHATLAISLAGPSDK